jgi:flagellar biosynthesis protein FlhA
VLIERVRQRLGQAICQSLLGENKALQVLTLDPAVESQLLHGMRGSAGHPAAVDPKLAEQLIARLVQHAERMMSHNLLPVLLCSPDLRRHLRALSERVLPHLRVLAMTEVPQNLELKSFAVVGS